MAKEKAQLPDPESPPEKPQRDTGEADIEAAAVTLLNWVSALDPSWKERIDILRSERGFSARETAASLMAYPLDNAMHMSMPAHPLLQAGVAPNPSGKLTCQNCGKEFKQAYAGQRPLCSNDCARSFDAKGQALRLSA